MFTQLVLIVLGVLVTASEGEALKCYHCYDNFDNILSIRNATVNVTEGQKEVFKRCGDDEGEWTVTECPPRWPSCVIIAGHVQNTYEVMRSCAAENFCSNFLPPTGVSVSYCSECTRDLCNTQIATAMPGKNDSPNTNINVKADEESRWSTENDSGEGDPQTTCN